MGLGLPYAVTINTDYVVTPLNDFIACDTTNSAINVYLAPCTLSSPHYSYRSVYIKIIAGSNFVNVYSFTNIEDQTFITLQNLYDSVILRWNGDKWYIVGEVTKGNQTIPLLVLKQTLVAGNNKIIHDLDATPRLVTAEQNGVPITPLNYNLNTYGDPKNIINIPIMGKTLTGVNIFIIAYDPPEI